MTTQESLIGLVEVSKSEAKLLLESAYFLIELGKFKEAQEVFEGACSLLPRHDVPRIGLGNLFVMQGRYDQAIQSYQDAIKANDNSASAHAFLGEVLLLKKQFDKAIPSLDKAKSLDPDGSAGKLAASLLQAHKDGAFA